MSAKVLPAGSEDNPRLEPIVSAAMKKAGLAETWKPTVLDLATGRLGRDTLRCCGSGCRPCVQDVLHCVQRVLVAWEDPRFEVRLLESADKSLSGRARRIARRAMRKLGS
ncbi:MAG: hypothetical protein VX498_07740 [Myxococcota bacterium]|nr:hypothetical protein [Myxococcota bacterium]